MSERKAPSMVHNYDYGSNHLEGSKDAAFQKLICNLLLSVHPICINKCSNPLSISNIFKYYLNYQTIWLEYERNICQSDNVGKINYLLYYASRYSNIIVVKWCLENGSTGFLADRIDALLVAAFYGNIKVVKFLINKCNNTYNQINNALSGAAVIGCLEIVKLLIAAGADVRSFNNNALLCASYTKHLEVVKLLIDEGADIHAQNDSALRNASETGNLELVKLLINKGANIHADNNVAVRMAAKNLKLEVVKFLIDRGADIHAQNDCTLKYAIRHHNRDV